MTGPRHQWNHQEETQLLALAGAGLGMEDIAVEMAIPYTAVKAKLELLRQRQRGRKDGERHGRISSEQIAVRDARMEARDLRDLTAQFFGDPPPGYSALDQRNGRGRR